MKSLNSRCSYWRYNCHTETKKQHVQIE